MYSKPIPSPTTTINRSSRSRPYSSCNDGTGLAVDTPDRSADHWQDACRKGAAGGHKQSVASEPQVLTAQSQWAMCQINWAPGHDGSSHGRRAARCPRTAAAAWIPAPWWSSSVLDGSASLTNWSTISTQYGDHIVCHQITLQLANYNSHHTGHSVILLSIWMDEVTGCKFWLNHQSRRGMSCSIKLLNFN